MASILCGDDDPFMHDLFRTLLTEKGYDVQVCANGQEVIAAVQVAVPDVILLDVEMPVLDGIATCEQLRRLPATHSLPVIIVSAVDTEDAMLQALSRGADDYLLKPVKAAELIAKITTWMRKKELARNVRAGLSPGQYFAGRYRIESRRGSGGSGQVFAVYDEAHDPPRQAALKVLALTPREQAQGKFLAGFLREAYAHAKLDHPNIAKLYDFGQCEGEYYLVTEFIDGESLDELLQHQNKMPETVVAAIGFELAGALEYLAEFGLMHRDITLANIMSTTTGDLKLLDFGQARQVEDATLSSEDKFTGSPDFVSPEHIQGLAEDVRTDIYSLGACLYCLVSGHRVFEKSSIVATLQAHLSEQPLPLLEVEPEITRTFANLIAQMLQKEPQDRPDLAYIREVCAAHMC